MRRLFTSFLLTVCCALCVQAQVKITCDGAEVHDGDELVFYAEEVADEFGMYDNPVAGPDHAPLFINESGAPIESFAVSVTTS